MGEQSGFEAAEAETEKVEEAFHAVEGADLTAGVVNPFYRSFFNLIA